MILVYLIVILLVGGVLSWLTGRWSNILPRLISLVAVMIDFVITLSLVGQQQINGEKQWMIDYSLNWIPHFGINLHLALDGLSPALIIAYFLPWNIIHPHFLERDR